MQHKNYLSKTLINLTPCSLEKGSQSLENHSLKNKNRVQGSFLSLENAKHVQHAEKIKRDAVLRGNTRGFFPFKTLTKNKIFGSMILAMLGSLSSSFADTANVNITDSVYKLWGRSSPASGKFFAGSMNTWSSAGASFSQSYLNATLIFGNSGEVANTSGGGIWFGRGGDVGYITASFNAKNIYLTSTLGAGNSWRTGGGASLNFSATQKANLQSLTLEFYKAGTQNSNFSVTANEIEANNTRIQDNSGGTTSFSANTYNIQNLSIQKSGGKVVFNNKTSAADSGKGSVALSSLSIENGYFIAPNLKATLSIKSLNVTNTTFQTKDINAYALTTGNNASYTQSNGTTTITGDWNLPTNAGTTHNSIAISNVDNFVSTGGIAIQTWGAYSASFTVNNVKNLTLNSVHLDIFTGGDTGVNTFNFSGVSGKATITNLVATGGGIHVNKDVNITNLTIRTADFNPTTNFYGEVKGTFIPSDTTYNITNLEIFGGWGATTKATAKFNSGKSLTIGTAKISNWSTLDAAAINNVKITTLESSYATIKAGANLEIDNATFSNNQTFLDSSGKITIGNITFNNGAELQIKSGQTLEAKNLIMHNGTLIAQAGFNITSNLTGDTTINKITLDRSAIYVNNLTTQEITIQNNAQIWLKNNNSGLYKNEGTLNISDGSNLTVHGNMENIGSLNFTLNPNNTELINVSGYFQFNMDAGTKKESIANTAANGKKEGQTIAQGIPESRINIYTSTQDLITGQTYILIHAGGGFQFLQNGQVYTSLSENTKYGELSQVFAQNIYFYNSTDHNKPLDVQFTSSTNNNTLSFYVTPLAEYVDIMPFIRPGTWPLFGGNAVFGAMSAPGGLRNDYTLTLNPQISTHPYSKGKPIIYYLQNYVYNNSDNPNAVFTVNAIGSKFVLGKNRETAGNTGKISIGAALARSTMKVNADDIYLGGDIVLGDGKFIGGNLILNAANKENKLGFIGSNDNNQQANIYIKNRSNLTAYGSVFNYQGTIHLIGNGNDGANGANGTVSNEVTLNLNGITGGVNGSTGNIKKITVGNQDYDIYIHGLVVQNANGANGGGIYAKNFYINTMQVNPGNYSPNDFMTNIGNSTINTLVFNGGTSGVDNAVLNFKQGGSLSVGTLELQNYGTLNASTLSKLDVSGSLSSNNSTIIFSKGSQEINIKNIVKFVNSTLSTSHFSSYGLSIGPNASFYQSADDAQGYATMVLKGSYKVASQLVPIINNSNMVFTKLTSLTAGTLEASPAGAYGSSIKLIDVQKATIQKIILSAPSAITNYPTFDARSSTNLNLNVRDIQSNSGYFYANNGGTTTISGQATFNNSVASFTNLDIAQNAALNYDSPTKITIAGNFNLNGSLNLNLTGNNLNTITIQGQTNIYLNNKNLPVLSVHNIEQLKNLKVGTEYILINSIGGINYHYNGTSGNTQMYQDQMIKEFGFYGNSNKRLDSVNDDAKLGGFFLAKIIRNNRIGFKISTAPTSTFNPFNPNQIEYYFFKKGGQDWIYALRNINPQQTERLTKLYDAILKTQSSTAEASAVKEWLNALDSSSNVTIDNFQVLMIDKHNPIWAWDVVKENNLQYFQTVAKKIDNAIGQLGSVNNKASSANILRLATDTNRESRLVQLSSTKAPEDFASITESLKHTRFASKNLDLASIYRQEMRQRHKNNLWGKAVGAANFVNGGSGTLYGINVGYDRYVKNAIIGGYAAYAYSDYRDRFGGFVQNRANNFNFGAYSRIFIEHGEIDINASTTVGWNRGFINSKEPITMSLNQNYHYNSYIENVNFTYGYIFYLQEKSLVLKSLVGISQYFVASSKIQGKADNAFNQDLAILASAVNKFALAFDAGLEMRKYMSATSYWYAHLGVSQDIFVMSGGGRTVTFVGNDTLRFFNNSRRNLRFTLLIGGEMKVYKRTFVNLGLGSKAGVFYKDIGVSGNVGVRYVF
ncbi:hypothetical glycine-rich autotransporter [Helicobacter mustelae]|uniref:vacuolating cytotoxin domain-containing protein n=1 Tax=Helicobacter mustelae TaxID=217 RepID=UPI000E00B8D7|nr:vacuolating cytotoxin domain-containing protein [Helicobacter mustelae]STP12564.1 hypothetical glycine-rich autotransporter [Helicobacter mustelae]